MCHLGHAKHPSSNAPPPSSFKPETLVVDSLYVTTSTVLSRLSSDLSDVGSMPHGVSMLPNIRSGGTCQAAKGSKRFPFIHRTRLPTKCHGNPYGNSVATFVLPQNFELRRENFSRFPALCALSQVQGKSMPSKVISQRPPRETIEKSHYYEPQSKV
jgi:hypothetical protein